MDGHIPRQAPAGSTAAKGGLAAEHLWCVVTISITADAYAAIEKTLPKGAEAWPAQPDGRGGVRLTLDRKTLDRLTALRGPGESYSDVILRLAKR